jgi:hypothetical protein
MMTQALMSIERVFSNLDTRSRKASYPVRAVLAFGIVAAGYAVVAMVGLHGIGVSGLA